MITIDCVKSEFEKAGCDLLEDEYKNTKTKMGYRCSCGNLASITFTHFKRGQRCRVCRYQKAANSMKLSFEYVAQYFKDNNCELLETEYINARKSMSYRCSCGTTSNICFDSFKNGNRCRKCGSKKSSIKQLLTHNEVNIFFAEHGCKLLSQYSGSNNPLQFICKCGKEASILWSNFKRKKRCAACGLKNRSGENHYEWREDRIAKHKDDLFRQRCYKLVRMVLNVTGRVKNKRTAELLGYDYKQLQEHITTHPNYNNVKDGKWHIDHIFPIKAFADHSITDLALINCLENLRPISQFENSSKNAKYDKEEFHIWLKNKGIDYANESSRV